MSLDSIAEAVWSNSERTLVSGTPEPSEDRVTRIAEAVWDYSVRTLSGEIPSGGVLTSGLADVSFVEASEPEVEARIYPQITFRVNLDFVTTLGVPCTEHSQFNLGLQTIAIPGVGRMKHGDEFTLDGMEASHIRRKYTKIGRLSNDPRDTLEILDVE